MIEAPTNLQAVDVTETTARLTWEWLSPAFLLTSEDQYFETSDGQLLVVEEE